MLHKKKSLNIKIRQKYITYLSLLLNTALIGIFKRQSLVSLPSQLGISGVAYTMFSKFFFLFSP